MLCVRYRQFKYGDCDTDDTFAWDAGRLKLSTLENSCLHREAETGPVVISDCSDDELQQWKLDEGAITSLDGHQCLTHDHNGLSASLCNKAKTQVCI